jgi:hypothetical protein
MLLKEHKLKKEQLLSNQQSQLHPHRQQAKDQQYGVIQEPVK